MSTSLLRVLPVLIVSAIYAQIPSEPADLVLHGGRVVSLDAASSTHEALAIRGNRIAAIGSKKDVAGLIGPKTRVIELRGAFVMPGMTDAHCHPFGLAGGDEDEKFSVAGARTFNELVGRVAARVERMKPGEWLIGGGWDQNLWPGGKIPPHHALSAVSPDNPVFLYRHDGNSAYVNAKALEIAGITAETPDPYGGRIGRLPDGSPSGFLVNMGNNLVKKHFPKRTRPLGWYRERYRRAMREANAAGLTGWHDAGVDPEHIEVYKSLVDRKELTLRSNVMLQNPRLDYDGTVAYFRKHRLLNHGGEHMLQVRSVKVFLDGALGSRGAALFDPYLDDPASKSNRGVYEIRLGHLAMLARAGIETGMQICPHSIGTRANSDLLDTFGAAFRESPGDHRFRSEHAECVRPEDVKRFAQLGIIASIQPIHCTSDMGFIVRRLGARRSRDSASPWRSMLDSGVRLASGSDFPVESHRPLYGIYAAVTRKDHDGKPKGGWHVEQCMTREEALRSYTTGPAYAAFLENHLGALEVGKLADAVVLDHDLLTCAAEDILKTRVLFTIVNGNVVFEGKR